MKKTVATTTAVAAALGGVVTGAVFTAGPAAIAQEDGANTEATEQTRLERATESIREALTGLVDEGVIDAGQADAVAEALASEAPARRGGHHRGGGAFGLGQSSALTDLLGLEPSELFSALAEGATLAEVAEAQGVDAEAVADLLVSEAQERLDAAVERGSIDEEVAAERAADLEETIDDLVNGEFPIRRGRDGVGRGSGADATDAVAEETATS